MNKKILLFIVLVAVIGLIIAFESTKPRIDTTAIDADIPIMTANERIAQKAQTYERAKELIGPEGYINIDNITLAEHIGKKVILIDFWTYSCINCQRTLPYLTSWHEKYADDGLLIIGVHTPEFEFEKDYDNLLKATQKWNVNYPVVQDNDRQTWRAYQNRYWPRKYLIDIDGFIVYDHIGEGAYEKTEEKIQELLQERNEVLSIEKDIDTNIVTHESDKGTSTGRTPEIYFGYKFSKEQLGNEQGLQPEKIINYTYPETKEKNLFYLEGTWKNNKDGMELISETGSISLNYYAKSINIVAGATNTTIVDVSIDGEKIKELMVQEHDLYSLYSGTESNNHTLALQTEKGFIAYTFTFG